MSKDQNWENGSFDEFIRRSVEDPQLEFDPRAWEAMEEKLDAQAGGTRSGETRSGGTGHAGTAGKIGGALVALLIMSLLGWFLLRGTEEDTIAAGRGVNQQLSNPASDNSNAAVDLQQEEVGSGPGENRDQASALSGSTAEGGIAAGTAGEKKRLSSSGSSEGGTGKNLSTVPVSKAERSPSSTQAGDAGSERAGTPGRGNNQLMNTDNTDNMSEDVADVLAEKEAAGEQALQKMPWQAFVFDKPEITPFSQAAQMELSPGEELEEEVVPVKGKGLPLSLSLSLAPDFSGMSKGVSARLGAGAGFHLEYRILPRLGLVTGLVYSQKNYLANSSYSPYDFGYYLPEPDHIDASCGVLDIPLNLRYYLIQGRRHSFFLSSGLSSYLMKSEDYTHVYTDGQHEDFTYEVRDENRHYFAVYNFSAGYEARISPRWALQVEPFLKIPAKGVGAGSIRLNSMGAFVHLKYQIGRPGN